MISVVWAVDFSTTTCLIAELWWLKLLIELERSAVKRVLPRLLVFSSLSTPAVILAWTFHRLFVLSLSSGSSQTWLKVQRHNMVLRRITVMLPSKCHATSDLRYPIHAVKDEEVGMEWCRQIDGWTLEEGSDMCEWRKYHKEVLMVDAERQRYQDMADVKLKLWME